MSISANRQPIFVEVPRVDPLLTSGVTDSERVSPSNPDLIFNGEASQSKSGSVVKRITFVATGETEDGLIRLWIGSGYGNYWLWKEIPVTAVTPSDTVPAWTYTLDLENDFQLSSANPYVPGKSVYMTATVEVQFSVIVEAGDY